LAEENITANQMLSFERLMPKFVNNVTGTDFKHELNDTAGIDFSAQTKVKPGFCVWICSID
jgi:hypothetical protein